MLRRFLLRMSPIFPATRRGYIAGSLTTGGEQRHRDPRRTEHHEALREARGLQSQVTRHHRGWALSSRSIGEGAGGTDSA